MCNRYRPSRAEEIERYFGIPPRRTYNVGGIGPWGQGPFIRPARESGSLEAVVGQWALIADGAKEVKSKARVMTNCARSESIATKWTYRAPWSRGQRCIVPAASYDYPNWETGSNVWWRFRRADGAPWALAGIWNDWTDPATGEIVSSYAVITQNADSHQLLNRMHKPEPDLPPDKQDKRSVVPREHRDWEAWLHGTNDEAFGLIRLGLLELYDAGPADH